MKWSVLLILLSGCRTVKCIPANPPVCQEACALALPKNDDAKFKALKVFLKSFPEGSQFFLRDDKAESPKGYYYTGLLWEHYRIYVRGAA